MAKIYYHRDANLSRLNGKTVAVIGYGSQGHAHALNLRDSQMDVVVGLPTASLSRQKAIAAGLRVEDVRDAVAQSQLVMMLTPDTLQADIYQRDVEAYLQPGDTLMFAHGFNIHFGQITPPPGVDVSLVAPKAPGHRVREVFQAGGGTPGLVAIAQDATGEALANALAYSKAIGCTRAGVIETTFGEETETDLFGEQAVLCGGVTGLIQAGFETLVEAGYQPEVAYFECLHELKLIVDLIYQGGLSYMWFSVSDTAEHGGYQGSDRLITSETRQEMKRILEDIRSGSYAKGWIAENRGGRKAFLGRRAAERKHPLEELGKTLRSQMPFLEARQVPVQQEEKEPVLAGT